MLNCLAGPTSQFLNESQEFSVSHQNGPAYGSDMFNSPASVGQSAGIWRVVAGKMYARALDLSI